MSYKEDLVPSTPGGREVFQDGKEPEAIQGSDRGEFVNNLSNNKLRARLKLFYCQRRQGSHGADIKSFWNNCASIFTVQDLAPAVPSLREVCNKSTMLYWDVSAQLPGANACPSIIFACIYKCWFRYHDDDSDIKFGKFFAQPFQITQTGPHTIPGILKAHAHLYDQAALDLESIKRGVEINPDQGTGWLNFDMLPLARAIIVLLDEPFLQPIYKQGFPNLIMPGKFNRNISLDDEVQRRTAVLVLTGFDQGLSGGVLNFDGIRSNALPLARDDVEATDKNMIRVSLKTAVQFIAKLQLREDKAATLNRTGGSAATNPEFAKDQGSTTTAKEAEEYATDVLAKASTDPSKARVLETAMEEVKLIDAGLMDPDIQFQHWSPRYV